MPIRLSLCDVEALLYAFIPKNPKKNQPKTFVTTTQSFNDNLVLLKLLIVLCIRHDNQDGKLQITSLAFNIQFACD